MVVVCVVASVGVWFAVIWFVCFDYLNCCLDCSCSAVCMICCRFVCYFVFAFAVYCLMVSYLILWVMC